MTIAKEYPHCRWVIGHKVLNTYCEKNEKNLQKYLAVSENICTFAVDKRKKRTEL